MSSWQFVKGHGTGNDFIVLVDGPDPTPEQVAALCDRHQGLGADGILRLETGLFMDYRNADGSIAEMCGNGVRVFARWLVDSGQLTPGTHEVETRGGTKVVEVPDKGDIRVDMGPPRLTEPRLVLGQPGTGVDMGNPHVVTQVHSVAEVVWDRVPLDVNVEVVELVGPREIRMRVHERGVGETQSCGTGACAAAVAVAGWQGIGPDGLPWTVHVPGGTLTVEWTPETGHLSGPAVLLASGTVTL